MRIHSAEQPRIRQEPETIWNRSFVSLFFTNMVLNMGQNMSNSLIAVYADYLGASAVAVGVVVGAFAVSAMCFRLISAPIIDTYNRKYVIVFSTVTLAASFGGYSVSNTVPMLMGFRLLQGFGMAFGNACCLTMVADMLPKKKYGSGIGYYTLAQVTAQAIGPSVGLELAARIGYQQTYLITAGIMLFSGILAFAMKFEFRKTQKLTFKASNIIAKEAFLPTIVLLLFVMATCGNSFLVIFARNQGITANIGIYFAVSAMTMLITRPIIGRLTDRHGPVAVSIPSLMGIIIALFILSTSTTLRGFLASAVISSFGQGGCMPAMQALSMKAVPPERRGAASCTNFIGMDIGALLGPIVAGALAQALGYTAMWRSMGMCSLVGIGVLLIFRKQIMQIETDFISR